MNYANRSVHWVADLDSNGQWLETAWVALEKGFRHLVPFIERQGPGLHPLLLFDKVDYALGRALGSDSESDRQKALGKHQAFRRVVKDCAAKTGNSDVRAIATALDREDLPAVPDTMKATHWVLFRVDGRFPVDALEVQAYWARRTTRETHEGDYQCIGCGAQCMPVDRHRVPISLYGGHAKGTKLISANDPAYSSYGLSESLIAPTCAECSRKYATALCRLIDSHDHHVTIGKLTYVFWTKVPTQSPLSLLQRPHPDAVREILQRQSGEHRQPHGDANVFYGATLSPNVSRIVVRDWTETTVGAVQDHLAAWFRKQRLTGVDGWVSLLVLASSLCSSNSKNIPEEIPPGATSHLIEHALYGRPLPPSLLLQALGRNVTEPAGIKFTPARLSLLKLYVLQTSPFKEDDLVALEAQRRDPGYVCGRILAELEHIQSVARGNANASLVDRYYGIASAAPNSVFHALLRTARYDLAKIRREKSGLAPTLSDDLEAIMGQLDEFPHKLLPQEQALFALGYYHQRRYIRDTVKAVVTAKEAP